MDTITVRTTQNIDIDYEIGGLGERMLSYILDILIFAAVGVIGLILTVYITRYASMVYFIVLGALALFYDLICEVAFNGQSVGKRIMKIRVISLDGGRPKFGQYLLRWLFRLIDFSITSYLAGTVTIIVTDKSQRIGDIVAGTVVVRTMARTTINDIIFKPTVDAYIPVFPQAAELKDEDIGLIHEVMNNYYKTGNSSVVYNMADRIRAHLAINLPAEMNSMQFLQTIINDYTHISSISDPLTNS